MARTDNPGRFCSRECARHVARQRSHEKHPHGPNYGGGAFIKNGYRALRRPGHPDADRDGYIFEHRLVMEEHLGRRLLPDEVVHHIDGNKLRNVPENLIVMTRAEHVRLHNPHVARWGNGRQG